MLEYKCEICGQPATIRETSVGSAGAVTRRLCQRHGAALLPPADSGPQSLRALKEQFQKLSDAEKEHFALLHRLTHRVP